MPLFDDADLREYAGRDWEAPARLARAARARLPVDHKLRLAAELREAARSVRPGWPDEKDREADLAGHRRLRALLERAADVGRR